LVLCELLRWGAWQKVRPELHFHAAHGGGEVDFILETLGLMLALEVKAGRSVHSSVLRSLRSFLDLTRSKKPADRKPILGIVVSQGREIEQVDRDIWAVPAWRLFPRNTSERSGLRADARSSCHLPVGQRRLSSVNQF
jgi:predicted AAA+ superfamily ATPase